MSYNTTTGVFRMDKKAIAERLRALASDDNKRSKAARLRDVIDDVEFALAAGVNRSSVLEELAAQGLEMTIATFDTTMKRIRQKRNKTSIASFKSVSQPQGQSTKSREVQPVVEAETESVSSVVGSHNPADLDSIIGSKPDLAALAKLAKRTKK
jgi:hypothetical protein